MDFLQVVSNVSFENLKEFRKFAEDKTMQNVDLLDLALKVDIFVVV